MAINPTKLILKQGKTALLICDIQTKFSNVIYEFDKVIVNTAKLINACKLLNVPMLVTEQNPKVLGSTVSEFDISSVKGLFPKMQFSMCTPEFNEALSKLCSGNRPETILLAGLEGHVCIENTAIDLRKEGFQVHAVADCISSRTPEDRFLALDRMKEIGCVIATSENIIFKLMGSANHEQFKNILNIVRTPSAHIEQISLSRL